MGIIDSVAQAASSTKAGVVASTAGTAWTLAGLPWSTVAAIGTATLTIFYLFAAIPRIARTAVALKRGLINRDWSLFKRMGDQPMAAKEE